MRANLVLFISVFFFSCIKEAKLNYREPEPSLVVEGLLLTDSTPCKVILSYSGLFNKNGAQLQNFIDDADVYLKDVDANDSVQLVNQQGGTYVATDGFVAAAGNAYAVSIHLSNGERYASIPERIIPVPQDFQIEDSIPISIAPGFTDLYGADVKIRTHDPADEPNYYRWITTAYIPRKTTGVPCGFNVPPCFQYCYQYFEDHTIYTLADKNINGNEIRGQTVLISPYYYYGFHFIEIKQLSLTEQAYEFWKLYDEQTTRTGTIFDPLPSPLQGNIYNVDDPNKLALGYFEASDVTSKRIILQPIFINSYYILQYYKRYESEGACYVVLPNAQTDAPPGWENAEKIIYDVY